MGGPRARAAVGRQVRRQLERVLSCANNVLTEGNSLLSDEELEMLVVLRMNRKFMEYMRKHYNHLTKDHFGKTVVSPADSPEVGGSSSSVAEI